MEGEMTFPPFSKIERRRQRQRQGKEREGGEGYSLRKGKKKK